MNFGGVPYELTSAKMLTAFPSMCSVASGSYTGDSTLNRAIPHGLGSVPKYILISDRAYSFSQICEAGFIETDNGAVASIPVTSWNSTNFYVGNSPSNGLGLNFSGNVYIWVAIL